MTSSSRHIIKKSEKYGSLTIENYMPPLEQLLNNREIIPREPVFPQYTLDGRRKDEEAATQVPPPDEFLQSEPKRRKKETTHDEQIDEEEPENREKLLEEWKEEGERLLEEARQEAEQILEEAQIQAQKEKEEAARQGHQEGYEEGYSEGRIKAEQDFREEIQAQLAGFQADMQHALKSVDTAKENCLRTYLEELKDCAVAIGEKVIHISLKSSGEVIKQMIISATEKLKKTAWVKIYIDKYDYDMMMAADAGVIDELSHLSDNIKFIVMDKEERGSCIIEMPEEIVDVSVNTQIENIKDILENVRI